MTRPQQDYETLEAQGSLEMITELCLPTPSQREGENKGLRSSLVFRGGMCTHVNFLCALRSSMNSTYAYKMDNGYQVFGHLS